MTAPGPPQPRQGLAGGEWQQADLVPRPDPTFLTNRAIELVTTQYRLELAQLRELLEARLDGMDAAAETHLRETAHLRHQLEEKIIHLGELMQEKFDGIDRRFEDRDARGKEGAAASEKALAAALQSAKELTELQNRANKELATQQDKANADAIAKAQGATNEKISALEQVGSTSRQALSDKIDDARTRLTTMESLTRGIKEAGGEQREVRGEQRLNISQVIAAIATLAAVITLVLYITKK